MTIEPLRPDGRPNLAASRPVAGLGGADHLADHPHPNPIARDIVLRSNALAPSGSLLRVHDEIRHGDTDARRLAHLIEGSPQLAVRVLRLANSGFYAPLQSISSLTRAVAVLGDVVLRQIVLASIVDARRRSARSLRQSVVGARLMGDAVRSAVVCRELAGFLRRDADTAFAAGLLHDLGRVYLLDSIGDTYAMFLDGRSMAPEIEDERAMFGVSHEDVGAVLALDWDVPESIAESLRAHHEPVHGTMAEVVKSGDVLVGRLSRPSRDDAEEDAEANVALTTIGVPVDRWTSHAPSVRQQIAELMSLFG